MKNYKTLLVLFCFSIISLGSECTSKSNINMKEGKVLNVYFGTTGSETKGIYYSTFNTENGKLSDFISLDFNSLNPEAYLEKERKFSIFLSIRRSILLIYQLDFLRNHSQYREFDQFHYVNYHKLTCIQDINLEP